MLRRVWRHVITTRWHLRAAFPAAALDHIEAAIHTGEAAHAGELRFAIEGALHLEELWTHRSAAARAQAVFNQLRVWDTDLNNGVLLYVLLAERAIEIVADRGYRGRVTEHEWRAACAVAEAEFAAGRYERGAIVLVECVNELIARHFPATTGHQNELPDRPVILR